MRKYHARFPQLFEMFEATPNEYKYDIEGAHVAACVYNAMCVLLTRVRVVGLSDFAATVAVVADQIAATLDRALQLQARLLSI